MVPVLILAHGGLAAELLHTAERIVGELVDVEGLGLEWEADRDALREIVADAVRRLDRGAGVLVLTVMWGDTPSNVALDLLGELPIEVVTGVNLPMVVRLACPGGKELGLSELARWIRDKGREELRLGREAVAADGGWGR